MPPITSSDPHRTYRGLAVESVARFGQLEPLTCDYARINIRLSSEVLEPVFAPLIAAWWCVAVNEGCTLDALRALNERVSALQAVAGAVQATHASVATNNYSLALLHMIELEQKDPGGIKRLVEEMHAFVKNERAKR